MTRHVCGIVGLFVFPFVTPFLSLGAQAPLFQCPTGFESKGASCQADLPNTLTVQSKTIELQVVKPGTVMTDAIKVKFKASSGIVHPESTFADPQGVARATWFRTRAVDTAAVAVDLSSAKGTAVGLLTLAPDAVSLVGLRLEPRDGDNQSWFTGSMLRDPARFEIRRITPEGPLAIEKEADCAAHRVSFLATAAAGAVSPDTMIATVQQIDSRLGCYVQVYWTLGPGPGPRRIRATLIPGAGFRSESRFVEVRALSRTLPKLVGGLALVQRREFLGLKPGVSRSVKVEQPRPDGTKISYDSIVNGAGSVDTIRNTLAAVAVFVGLTGPVIPGWQRFSATAGVDLGAPRDRWYVGLSVLRLIDRATESFNFDIHAVFHWSKDAVLVDPTACGTGGSCKTEKNTRFQGVGLLATLDAGTILADLIKKLAP
jgi:hypothetical protein